MVHLGRRLRIAIATHGMLSSILWIGMPAPPAAAALVNPKLAADTPLLFFGSVDYRVRNPGESVFSSFVFDVPAPLRRPDQATQHWFVRFNQANVDNQPPRQPGQPIVANDLEVLSIHRVPPPGAAHGEGEGRLLQIMDFLNVTAGTSVVIPPGRPDAGKPKIETATVPHDGHRNFIQARVDAVDANTSRISVRIDHLAPGDPPPPPVKPVPIPPALLLLASAMALLPLIARRARA
jgi:hypothetical protein